MVLLACTQLGGKRLAKETVLSPTGKKDLQNAVCGNWRHRSGLRPWPCLDRLNTQGPCMLRGRSDRACSTPDEAEHGKDRWGGKGDRWPTEVHCKAASDPPCLNQRDAWELRTLGTEMGPTGSERA